MNLFSTTFLFLFQQNYFTYRYTRRKHNTVDSRYESVQKEKEYTFFIRKWKKDVWCQVIQRAYKDKPNIERSECWRSDVLFLEIASVKKCWNQLFYESRSRICSTTATSVSLLSTCISSIFVLHILFFHLNLPLIRCRILTSLIQWIQCEFSKKFLWSIFHIWDINNTAI